MKLINMVDFVLDQGNPSNTDSQFTDKVMAYANFLKQPLTLGMFVPCDLDGNILQKEIGADFLSDHDMDKFLEYEESKERILFQGWNVEEKCVDSIVIGNKEIPASIEFSENGIWIFDEHKVNNIEQLLFYSDKEKIEIVLTEPAKKQIGL